MAVEGRRFVIAKPSSLRAQGICSEKWRFPSDTANLSLLELGVRPSVRRTSSTGDTKAQPTRRSTRPDKCHGARGGTQSLTVSTQLHVLCLGAQSEFIVRAVQHLEHNRRLARPSCFYGMGPRQQGVRCQTTFLLWMWRTSCSLARFFNVTMYTKLPTSYKTLQQHSDALLVLGLLFEAPSSNKLPLS